MAVLLALRRGRTEDPKFQIILGDIITPRPAWST